MARLASSDFAGKIISKLAGGKEEIYEEAKLLEQLQSLDLNRLEGVPERQKILLFHLTRQSYVLDCGLDGTAEDVGSG